MFFSFLTSRRRARRPSKAPEFGNTHFWGPKRSKGDSSPAQQRDSKVYITPWESCFVGHLSGPNRAMPPPCAMRFGSRTANEISSDAKTFLASVAILVALYGPSGPKWGKNGWKMDLAPPGRKGETRRKMGHFKPVFGPIFPFSAIFPHFPAEA